jgi:hypothetical protein
VATMAPSKEEVTSSFAEEFTKEIVEEEKK